MSRRHKETENETIKSLQAESYEDGRLRDHGAKAIPYSSYEEEDIQMQMAAESEDKFNK